MQLKRGFRHIGVLITFSWLLAACGGTPGIDEVKDTVLNEILNVESIDRPVIVFALPEPLQPGDVIGAYQMDGFEPLPESRTIEAETWFYFVDDFPGAEYAHPTRFVYVDVETGAVDVQEEQWWPVLNGQGLWTTDDEYWDPENWSYSNGDFRPQDLAAVRGTRGELSRRPLPFTDGEASGKAIVINGWQDGEAFPENFAENVTQVSGVFTSAGFDTSYFGPENPALPDAAAQEGALDVARIGDWFRSAGEELKAGDTLMVYITSHGFAGPNSQGQLGVISERTLQFWLRRIDPSVNVVVNLQGCYSGAFIDGLRDLSDLTLTSTNSNSISVGDIDGGFLIFGITEPNPDDKGSEFTNGWVSDWNEIQADPTQREHVEARAAKNKTDYWTELSALSYVSSLEKDAGFLSGLSFPMAARGSVVARPVVLIDATQDGMVCRTGEPLQIDTPAKIDIGTATFTANPETDTTDVRVILPRAEMLEVPLFGGIEFRDPNRAPSAPSSFWMFEGLGNLNFSFSLSDHTIVPNVHSYQEGVGWKDQPDVPFHLEITGNELFATIPNGFIPPDASFYVSLTDGQVCDAVGLTAGRMLTGSVPSHLIDDTISAPDKLPLDGHLPASDADSSSGGTGPASFEGSLLVVDDPPGDVVSMTSGSPVDDPQADLGRVLVEYDRSDANSNLMVQIQLGSTDILLGQAFSFAVNIQLALDGVTQSSYLYQTHAGVDTIGRVDPASNTLIPSIAELILRERVLDGKSTAVLELDIPHDEIPLLNQIPIVSYHMANNDSDRTSDSLLIMITPTLVPDSEP